MNKITPADISDPQEVVARATALSLELGTPITPGFEALVFKASRGIEDIDAIMTTDPAGIITDVNKQMEALTGCMRDELIGAPFKNYFTDPELAEASIKLVLSEKKVSDYELTARARDGKETVVSYNATTFYDRDRRLQGVFAAARDVTERKRLDQVLKEKNVELESATLVAERANLAKSAITSSPAILVRVISLRDPMRLTAIPISILNSRAARACAISPRRLPPTISAAPTAIRGVSGSLSTRTLSARAIGTLA